MKEKYKNDKFHFVIGGDIIQTIGSWGNADKLITENSFIVFQRKGYSLNTNRFPQNRVVEIDLPEISSSYVKKVLYDTNV